MRFLYIFTTTWMIITTLFMVAAMFYYSVIGDMHNTGICGLLCFGNIAMLSYVIDSWLEYKDKL